MTEESLLTTHEAAQKLSVSRNHLVGLIRSGRLEAIDVGNGGTLPRYRIRPDAIRSYMTSHGTGHDQGNTPSPGGSSGGVRTRGG